MTDHQTTDEGATIGSDTLDSLRNGVEAVVTGSFLFRSLEPESRRDLADRGVVMVFPAAKVVLTEGDPSSDFYLIDQGVAEVTTTTPDGAPVVLATLQHGAFFGEVALLKGLPRTATVTALTDLSVVRFDQADIEDVLSRNPGARRILEAMIEGRARDTVEKVVRALSNPPPSDPDPTT
jgi:ATP-binding cassette subfamily B protein